MTVTTTVADAKLEAPGAFHGNPADLAPFTVATIFPAELTGLGVLFAGLRRRKTLGTQKMRLLLMIVFTLGILGLVGCGCPSTAFHSYSINITGTSLSFPGSCPDNLSPSLRRSITGAPQPHPAESSCAPRNRSVTALGRQN